MYTCRCRDTARQPTQTHWGGVPACAPQLYCHVPCCHPRLLMCASCIPCALIRARSLHSRYTCCHTPGSLLSCKQAAGRHKVLNFSNCWRPLLAHELSAYAWCTQLAQQLSTLGGPCLTDGQKIAVHIAQTSLPCILRIADAADRNNHRWPPGGRAGVCHNQCLPARGLPMSACRPANFETAAKSNNQNNSSTLMMQQC